MGYCQGLSFLAASLLLHVRYCGYDGLRYLQLDEATAFSTLVKIMYDYGLRELFKPGFETLHLRFYQLDRLIQVHGFYANFRQYCKFMMDARSFCLVGLTLNMSVRPGMIPSIARA